MRYGKLTRRYVLRHSNLQYIVYGVSRRPFTTQAWVQTQILTREICRSGTALPRSISFLPVNTIPSTLRTRSFIYCGRYTSIVTDSIVNEGT